MWMGTRSPGVIWQVTGCEGGREVNSSLAFLTEEKALTCWERAYSRGAGLQGCGQKYVAGVD